MLVGGIKVVLWMLLVITVTLGCMLLLLNIV